MSLKGKKYKIEDKLKRTEFRHDFKGKEGVVLCKVCSAVYYKKSWHHGFKSLKNFRNNMPVAKAICPACEMIKNRQFEGEIRLANVPLKIKTDLVNMAKAFAKREYQREPMRRIINISANPRSNQRESAIVITTTENQMAVKLAKKIKEVFKKMEMKISYSSSPSDVVYIKMSFKEPPVA